jgi:hypothetical protein
MYSPMTSSQTPYGKHYNWAFRYPYYYNYTKEADLLFSVHSSRLSHRERGGEEPRATRELSRKTEKERERREENEGSSSSSNMKVALFLGKL